MNNEMVFECLFSITDDQTEYSEIYGDSDYKKNDLPSIVLINFIRTILWSS